MLPTPRMYVGLHLVHAACRHCGRVVPLDLAAIITGGHGDTPLIDLPLRCTGCDRTGHSIIVSGWLEQPYPQPSHGAQKKAPSGISAGGAQRLNQVSSFLLPHLRSEK